MDLADIWYERMKRLAREAPPRVDDYETPDFGSVIAPHFSPKNSRPNPHATEFSKLHPTEQARQLNNIKDFSPEGVDLSHEGVVNRLMQTHFKYTKNPMRAAKYHEGGNFYHEANDYVKQKAQEHGLHPRQVAGVVAALSPGTDWDRGIGQVNHLLEHHREYDHIPHSPTAAQHYHATIGPANSEGVVRNTASNYSKAFHILRGENVDEHLGGHKVRSFFNNIIDPHNHSGRNDVTMDRHAVSAAVGGTLGPGRLRGLFYGNRKYNNPDTGEIHQGTDFGSSASHNIKGTYAHFADAYREAHRRLQDMGEDPGASPAHFQAKIWGIWRKDAADNHKKDESKRKIPHYASEQDMGQPLEVWQEHNPEPDPDLEPGGNDSYWKKIWAGWPKNARDHQSPSIHTEIKEGYGLEDEDAMEKDAVFYPITSLHHLASDMDEFLFEGSAANPQCQSCGFPAATDGHIGLYKERSNGEPLVLCGDCAEALHPHIEKEGAGECQFCHQQMVPGEHLTEDSRAHSGCAEDHEAQFEKEGMLYLADSGTGEVGNWAMDTNQGYSHGGQTPSPKKFEDGSQYREDAEGNPKPSEWWQQQHSTGAENPASTGPQSFGDTLDPAMYPLAHGQTKPDEQTLAPGPSITSMTFGPNWGFDYTAAYASIFPINETRVSAEPDAPQDTYDKFRSDPVKCPHCGTNGERGRDCTACGYHQASLKIKAALSASEQDELIHEGEKEGVLASNFDQLNLEGTHYASLEEEFLQAEAEDD